MVNDASVPVRLAVIEAAIQKVTAAAESTLLSLRESEATIEECRQIDTSQSSLGELAQIEGAFAVAEAAVEAAKREHARAMSTLAAARYTLAELRKAA